MCCGERSSAIFTNGTGTRSFLSFCGRLIASFRTGTLYTLSLTNYGTHGKAEVKTWLRNYPRFVIRCAPTNCSWLNPIEQWLAELTIKRIRHDSFFSVDELVGRGAVSRAAKRPFLIVEVNQMEHACCACRSVIYCERSPYE
jgi:hypothetical protein